MIGRVPPKVKSTTIVPRTRQPAEPPAVEASLFRRSDLVVIGASVVAIVIAALFRFVGGGSVLAFVTAAIAVALLATLVGRSTDQLGGRLGAGATGVLQSALGNLPELFIGFFALRAGLVNVVQGALIGSILANLLLVLGAAFVVGGVRHGRLKFSSSRIRSICAMLALATAALVLPSIATYVHSPAAGHAKALSTAVAVVLLVVFALSLPASIRRQQKEEGEVEEAGSVWPLWLAIAMLTGASVAAAFVSDWFVNALQPAMTTLHISQAFAGLVVVAIASNAVENVVGIQLAARNQAEYAISVIVNSPLQIALVLAPALVLLSLFTGTALTLVFAPMLVVSVVLTVLVVTIVVTDGEGTWLEGAMLIGLYFMIAAVFWWG